MGSFGFLFRLVFIASLSRWMYYRLDFLGYFRENGPTENDHSLLDDYNCYLPEQLQGQGAEDIAITSSNIALISSGLMWPVIQLKELLSYEKKSLFRLNA